MNFEEYYDTAFQILRNAHTELETLAAENQLIDFLMEKGASENEAIHFAAAVKERLHS